MRLVIFAPDYLLDGLSDCLFEAGAGGLEEKPGRLSIESEDAALFAQLKEAVETFTRRVASFDENAVIEVSEETSDTGWQDTWQKALTPENVTPTFVMRPTHCAPAPPEEETIWFEPQASFGAGGHPTTKLAATRVEELVRKKPSLQVLDVGCGSGVLGIIANKSGAARVLCVDNDQTSVSAAETNLALNAVTEGVTIALGSANYSIEKWPLVIANINTPILHDLCADLCSSVAPGGSLLLTGLLEEDSERLQSAFAAEGLNRVNERHLEGWTLLEFNKS